MNIVDQRKKIVLLRVLMILREVLHYFCSLCEIAKEAATNCTHQGKYNQNKIIQKLKKFAKNFLFEEVHFGWSAMEGYFECNKKRRHPATTLTEDNASLD